MKSVVQLHPNFFCSVLEFLLSDLVRMLILKGTAVLDQIKLGF